MLEKEIFSILKFKAISPIFAGSGIAITSVDLPIQRERHTGWPHIQASSVKGALRDHFRKYAEKKSEDDKEVKGMINYIFGSDDFNDKGYTGHEEGLASSISVSDAKLLFFPMRSNIAPFVYVTCPSILKRLETDLEFTNMSHEKILKNYDNILKEYDFVPINNNSFNEEDVVLEDIKVTINKTVSIHLNENFSNGLENVLLISDEAFDYCVTSCTEVQTQITINSLTGVTKDGSLRYQELLPADTVLYSVIYISRSTNDDLKAQNIYNYITDSIREFIQIGGDETLGRGICKIEWINKL